jgi:hypothetical protein
MLFFFFFIFFFSIFNIIREKNDSNNNFLCKYSINIDYYMAFSISYPLSALEPRGPRDDI